MLRVATLLLGFWLIATKPMALLGQENSGLGAEVATQSLPFVITLRAYDSSGTEISLGSGFILPNGRIATNLHVIANADWLEVVDHQGMLIGIVRHAEAISPSMDLAILPRINDVSGGLRIQTGKAEPGMPVWVIGSPHGLSGSVSAGVVSAVRTLNGRRFIQITAPVSHGSSGGPILNREGSVIGVVTGILDEGQNLNFGIPSSALAVLRDAAPVEISFPIAYASEAREESSASAEYESNWEQFLRLAAELHVPGTQSGALTSSDLALNGKHFDAYRIEAFAGDHLQITAISSQFDSYLGITSVEQLVAGVSDRWVQEDDDSGSGLNAMLDVTIPETGAYLILIASYEAGEQGEYRLVADQVHSGEGRHAGNGDGLDERWYYIGASVDGFQYWIDKETIHINEQYVSLWQHTIPPAPEANADGEEYDAVNDRYRYDCQRRRVAHLSSTYYLDGRLVGSREWSRGRPAIENDWSTIVPESVGEAVFEAVCEMGR